jgi:hypothetical protein
VKKPNRNDIVAALTRTLQTTRHGISMAKLNPPNDEYQASLVLDAIKQMELDLSVIDVLVHDIDIGDMRYR